MSNTKGPIFEVIYMICDGDPNDNTAYKVFSYKDPKNFRDLWGLDAGDDLSKDSITTRLKCWAKNYTNKELTVVIVWDGMPTAQGDTLNVSGFVSPHDWAMAVSWSIYNKKKNPCLKDLKLRIFILKVDPSVSSFASLSLFAFQNALPWIQDYRVVGPDREAMVIAAIADGPDELALQRQAFPPEYRNMEMFIRDLLDPSRVLTTYPCDDLERKHYIELTKDLWIQNLLKAETRHSVANLVAPTVLAWGLPNNPSNSFRDRALKNISKGSPMRRALISTLRDIGFLKTSLNGSSNTTNGLLLRYNPGLDVFERQKNIRFVLVDDQFDLGYDHVLAYTLFGESKPKRWCSGQNGSLRYDWNTGKKGSLTCDKNLDWLLEYLDNSICDWTQPQYLFKDKCDVLFLDLRLWDEKENSSKEVMKKIICVANQLLENTSNIPPKLVEALEAAKEARDNEIVFPPKALTLLPLLLSCIDRTLPIVLFTSSHQRVVSEMLQDFPNVITSFVKPLISGYGELISPEDSMSDLEDAIKKAIELHEARIAWKRICDLEPRDACFILEGDQEECVLVSFNKRLEELRLCLVELFETCAFGDSVYESISLPWEFLEYEVARCNKGYERIKPQKDSRGDLAAALKRTRNAKTHGNLERNAFRDVNARCVALLQLLFLLDFLENKCRGTGQYKSMGRCPPKTKGPIDVLWILNHSDSWESLTEETQQALQNLKQFWQF